MDKDETTIELEKALETIERNIRRIDSGEVEDINEKDELLNEANEIVYRIFKANQDKDELRTMDVLMDAYYLNNKLVRKFKSIFI